MEEQDQNTGLGVLALLGCLAAIGASVVIDAIPESVGWGLLVAGSVGIVLTLVWLLSGRFRGWEPFDYRYRIGKGGVRSRSAGDAPIVLQPDAGRSGEASVAVTNNGLDGEFAATGQVLAVTGDPNPPRLSSFKVCWRETDDGIMQIERGQTRHLRLAQSLVEDEKDRYGGGRLHRLNLLRMEAAGCDAWDWFRWHDAGERSPEITVSLTVSRLGVSDPETTEGVVVIKTHQTGGVSVGPGERPIERVRDEPRPLPKVVDQEPELGVRVDGDFWGREYWCPDGRRYVVLRPVRVANQVDRAVAVSVRLNLLQTHGIGEFELDPCEDPPDGYNPRREWLGDAFEVPPRPGHVTGELGYLLPQPHLDLMGIAEESSGAQAFKCELIVENVTTGVSEVARADRGVVLNRDDLRP